MNSPRFHPAPFVKFVLGAFAITTLVAIALAYYIQQNLAETPQAVFPAVGLGLAFLYLAIVAVGHSTSRAWIRRGDEYAQLYAQERKRARQMRIVNDADKQLSAILDPDQLPDQVLRIILERFYFDRAAIYLMQDHRLLLASMRGYPADLLYHPERVQARATEGGLIAQAAQSGKSAIAPNAQIDSRWIPYGPDDTTRVEIAVPMLARGRVIGVIDLASDRDDALEHSDAAVLESLAAQAAVAIENARLYAAARRNVWKLSALRSIDHAIGATLDLQRTLDLLLTHTTAHVADAESAGMIVLVQPESKRLRIAAAKNLGAAFVEQFNLRVGESIIGRVAEDGVPREVTDLARDPRANLTGCPQSDRLASVLAVPLRAEGKIIGVLAVYTRLPHHFDDEEMDFFVTLGGQAALAVQNAQLYERMRLQAESLAHLTQQLDESYTATLAAMSAALDARDHETQGHSQHVARLTLAVARAMGITDTNELLAIERGALLHDIGKIGVSDAVLRKAGALTPTEWEEMKQHPLIGAEMLRHIRFLEGALPIIRHHHERWNGSGYPAGLKGAAIPLAARIFAVVDAYDALTSSRPYRPALRHAEAMAQIRAQSGIEFDPRVVEKFSEVMEETAWHTVRGENLPRAIAPVH